MSIKRLAPEAIETFAVVLHPKRKFSARATYLRPEDFVPTIPDNALLTEASEPIITEDTEYIVTED